MTYKVIITATADGKQEYMQIISEDQFSTNIVLIADRIEVVDTRFPYKPNKKGAQK